MGASLPHEWEETGFIPYSVMKERLLSIRNLRDAGLLACLYACGCRQGELRLIRKQDVYEESRDGFKYLSIRVPASKVRGDKYHSFKLCAIPLQEVKNFPDESWLANIILEWVRLVGVEFPFFVSTRFIRKLTNKYFGVNAHFLRHSRITHFGMWGLDGTKYFTQFWKTLSQFPRYSHLDAFAKFK
jgi:integrase